MRQIAKRMKTYCLLHAKKVELDYYMVLLENRKRKNKPENSLKRENSLYFNLDPL